MNSGGSLNQYVRKVSSLLKLIKKRSSKRHPKRKGSSSTLSNNLKSQNQLLKTFSKWLINSREGSETKISREL
jgi:hypothetical protein